MKSSTFTEPELVIRPARTVWAILLMRLVRNQVCRFMTSNNKRISLWDQLKWYFRVYKDNPNYVGFLASIDGDPIGYGLIVNRGGKWSVTAGFVESARGKGFGRRMFGFLNNYVFMQLKQEYVYLDVLKTNAPAISLYESMGFQHLREFKDTYLMRLSNPWKASI